MSKVKALEDCKQFYSVYRGFVADNKDPMKSGRLKLRVPTIYDGVHDYWADGIGMFSTKGAGFFIIPKINDAVWVMFENGDPRYPLWLHGWYGDDELPEEGKNNGEEPTNVFLKTYDGKKIEFDDVHNLIRLLSEENRLIELNENGTSVVDDKAIYLGSKDTADESAAMGDTLKELLDAHMDEVISLVGNIMSMIFPTSMGPTGTVSNPLPFEQIRTRLQSIKDRLPEILSQKVYLDKK